MNFIRYINIIIAESQIAAFLPMHFINIIVIVIYVVAKCILQLCMHGDCPDFYTINRK